eukprot:1328060-Pyramimonas_sp.AAC.1
MILSRVNRRRLQCVVLCLFGRFLGTSCRARRASRRVGAPRKLPQVQRPKEGAALGLKPSLVKAKAHVGRAVAFDKRAAVFHWQFGDCHQQVAGSKVQEGERPPCEPADSPGPDFPDPEEGGGPLGERAQFL